MPGEPNKDGVRFEYGNTAMWEKSLEDLLGLKHMELLPMLPLTRGGAKREIVEYMFAHLAGEQYRQLATMGFLFATLAFRQAKRQSDQEWLESRFEHMHDILRESPAYQWILDEGREEGKKEGIQAMQQAAINVVTARFAELEALARTRITAVSNLEHLQHLIIDLSISHSQEEMERVLHSFNTDV
jgi:predicted transposase YdaD